MKKVFLPLLSCTALIILLACNNGQLKKADSNTRTLVGRWEPVDVDGKDISDKEKMDILTGGYMEFKKGGRFTILPRDGSDPRSGMFDYDEKTGELRLISGEEQKIYRIEWKVNNKLVLIVPEDDFKITFNKQSGTLPDKTEPADNTDIGTNDSPAEKGIVGVWKPVDFTGENTSEEEKLKILNNAAVEFTVGGNYISTFDEKTEYGKYYLEPGSIRLETEGRTDIMTIERLSDDRMILKDDKGSMTLQRKN